MYKPCDAIASAMKILTMVAHPAINVDIIA
jgi:hypothetical protein